MKRAFLEPGMEVIKFQDEDIISGRSNVGYRTRCDTLAFYHYILIEFYVF